MACIGSQYTFQSSGTAGGNAYDSVIMSPIANGSIQLVYKSGSTTVYTKFLKVLPLALTRNGSVLSWTNVGADEYTVQSEYGGDHTVTTTTYTVPSVPYTDNFTVTCTINGETLPNSNEVSVPGYTPTIVFQSYQYLKFVGYPLYRIPDNSYSITTLVNFLNELLQPTGASFSYNAGTGRVTFTPPEEGITFSDSTVDLGEGRTPILTNFYTLRHLGFDQISSPPQIVFGDLITSPVTTTNVLDATIGTIPTLPPGMTFTVSNITDVGFTATYTEPSNIIGVQFILQSGGVTQRLEVGIGSSPFVFDTLDPDTTYQVSIQALSSYDYGELSDPVLITTEPSQPSLLDSSWIYEEGTQLAGQFILSLVNPTNIGTATSMTANLTSDTGTTYPASFFAADALLDKYLTLTYDGTELYYRLIGSLANDSDGIFVLNLSPLSGNPSLDPSGVLGNSVGVTITEDSPLGLAAPIDLAIDSETSLLPLFTWSPATGTNPTSYTVRLLDESSTPVSEPVTTTEPSYQLETSSGNFGIPLYFTNYILEVKATDGSSTSEWSQLPVVILPADGMSVPTEPGVIDVSNTSITFSWGAPDHLDNYPGFTYTVIVTQTSPTTELPPQAFSDLSSSTTTQTINNLTAGYQYSVSVKTVIDSYSSSPVTVNQTTTGFTLNLGITEQSGQATSISANTGLGTDKYRITCTADGNFQLSGFATGSATLKCAFTSVYSDAAFDAAVFITESQKYQEGTVEYVFNESFSTIALTPVDVLGIPQPTQYSDKSIGAGNFTIQGTVRSINGASYSEPCFSVWVENY